MQTFMWQAVVIGVAKSVNACMNKMNPSLQGQASEQPDVAGRDVIRSDLLTALTLMGVQASE